MSNLKEEYPLAYWKGRYIDMLDLCYAHPTEDNELAVRYAKKKIEFLERKASMKGLAI
jgi:hypothetical protein